MKLTPLKVAMCFSVLIHGGVLSAYFALRPEAKDALVNFQHEPALEIEIVSEPVFAAPSIPAPMVVKMSQIPEPAPRSAPPPLVPEIKRIVLANANILSSADDRALEVEAPMQLKAVEIETNAAPPTARPAVARNLAPEINSVLPANYLLNPKPVYPAAARKRKEEGLVVLSVQVDREGLPKAIHIVRSSGFSLLDEAASQAVNSWRFTPAKLGNLAVASQIEVPIRFRLTSKTGAAF